MVIVSRYVEIAAGSVIVPIKLGDNEKCPFCDSNHFLLLVDFFELYEVAAILCLQRKWLIVLHLLSMLSPQDNFAMQIYPYEVIFLKL